MLRHKLLFIGIFFSLSQIVGAQAYSFLNYSIKEGLVQSQTTEMVQDDRGYLWISTLGGVSRFDGRNFTNFTTKNGLVSNTVHSVYHNNGIVYIGCNGGLSVYSDGTISSFQLPPEAKEDRIIAIFRDKHRTWLGTDNSGLWYLENDSLINLTELPFVSVDKILNENDYLVLGTNIGMIQYSPFNGTSELISEKFPEVFVSDIAKVTESEYWISTYRNGIYKIKNGEIVQLTEVNGLISDRIRNLSLDHTGQLWAVSKKGISKITDEGIQNFNYENGLPTNDIKNVLVDRQQNIWLATSSNGILKLANEKVQIYWEDQGLCSAKAIAIIADEDDLWIGSYDNGICKISNGEVINMNEADGLIHNRVWAALKAKNGDLWFGTSSGLCKISKNEILTYHQNNGLINDRITALFQDEYGAIWIGHKQGISKIFQNEIYNYSSTEGFDGQRIRHIVKHQGKIFLGAENGLFTFDGIEFKQLKDEKLFKQNAVLNIAEDSDNNLWLGTKNGLYRYDHQSFNRIDFSPVSSADYIVFTTLFENWLFIGTNNGLYLLDINQYNNDGSVFSRHFGLEDGLSSLECNLNSSAIDRHGNLYFGTGNGTVKFKIKDLADHISEAPPTIHIDGLRVFMEPYSFSKSSPIEFKSDENHITLDFTGIDLSHPNDLSYEYRLNGLEEDFLEVEKTGSISYPYLPHGDYQFEINAINKAGVKSLTPAVINFSVLPPFYLTKWFLFIAFLIGIGVVFLILNWRRRVQRRRLDNQRLLYQSKILELEQQSLNSSMNRHFIFNALNSIQYYINRQDKLAANKYLSNFAKLIRKNLDSSQENLTLLSTELDRISLYLSLEHMRFQDKFDYNVEIDPDINPEQVKLPSMLLQPFLENSIWHGILPNDKRGQLKIKIEKNSQSSIKIIIDDNGIGVNRSLAMKSSKHNGHDSKGVSLTNDRIILYQKLTHENFRIKGPFEIKDKKEQIMGTRVEIYIPDNQAFERIIKEANKLGKLSLNY